LKPMMAFGMSGIVSSLGIWMMNLGDRLVIGHFMDAEALGIYAATYSFAFLLMAVNGPILMPAYPRLQVALAKEGVEDAAREARTFHRYICLMIVPSTLFLLYMSGPVLLFLGGAEFNVDPIMVGMVILAVAMDQFNGLSHYVLYSKDQMKFSQNTWIAAGIANLLLNWVLVPHFGLRGSAFTTLMTYFFLEVAIIARALRYLPLRALYRFDVAAKALASGSAGILAVFLMHREVPATAAGIISASAVFTAVYLAGLVILREVKKEDFDHIRNAVSRRPSDRR
jgi:O-antigen/teichoic acid export membrane protein